jgi:hypothetical protein
LKSDRGGRTASRFTWKIGRNRQKKMAAKVSPSSSKAVGRLSNKPKLNWTTSRTTSNRINTSAAMPPGNLSLPVETSAVG